MKTIFLQIQNKIQIDKKVKFFGINLTLSKEKIIKYI
jgi:hypothetical protein